MFKIEFASINISSTSIIRSFCKKCGSPPVFLMKIRNNLLWKNPGDFITLSDYYKKYNTRMCSDYYTSARYFSMTDISHTIDYNAYNPKLHSTLRSYMPKNNNIADRNNIAEIMMCECGGTSWHYNQKSVKNRPEIANRKGKYSYPSKFEY